jgi:hypothetical protein
MVYGTPPELGMQQPREAVAGVDNRTYSEALVLGGAVGMLKHGGGGVPEGSPMSFHLCELAMSVRGRTVGCVPHGRYHGAARNINVVRITVELDGEPECTSKVQARVQAHDVRENGRKGGSLLLEI